jgi:nicotinamide-nucleotide amidase
MPGVPKELFEMVAAGALSHLPRAAEAVSVGRICHVGIPERQLGFAYGEFLIRGRNPLVAIAPKRGHVELCIRATHAHRDQAEALLRADMEALARISPESIISLRGEAPAERVARELLERGLTLSVAESLTGGLIGHQLTEIPGISDALQGDFVVYSNAAKARVLGVPSDLIERQGAVSEEVACAMAKGARTLTGADLAIATTGIAGPGGGCKAKPVGLVWVGVADQNGTAAERRILPGNRSEVKDRAAAFALDFLRRRCSWGQGG